MKNIVALLFLFFSFYALSINHQIALIVNADNLEKMDDDERRATEWFIKNYPVESTLLKIDDIMNEKIDLNQFKSIWISIDSVNIDGQNTEYLQSDFLQKIKIFHQNGGNLLLTNYACQMISEIGRIDFSPNIISTSSAVTDSETWTLNPTIAGVCKYEKHPVYENLISSRMYPYTTYRMISSGLKDNHNCIWDLSKKAYNGDPLTSFEKETNSRVIGTWGQNESLPIAGVVEFFSTDSYKGRCIAIGLGAYEWNKNDTENLYQSNIERLTANCIEYLDKDLTKNSESELNTYYSMELDETNLYISESISGINNQVVNNKPIRENVPGVKGNSVRFDGFSTYVNGVVNADQIDTNSYSVSFWCALESYPMMNQDGIDQSYTNILGNEDGNAGFSFLLNCNGNYGFQCYLNGVKYQCISNQKLEKYNWVNLIASVDKEKNEIILKNNGVIVAKSYVSSTIGSIGQSKLMIGKGFQESWLGPFSLNNLNGLIDEIEIYSGIENFDYDPASIENPADLSIPSTRFEDEIHRPVFHGMPGANWTNEPHGLLYYNGKNHIFFQKNGNGPYWGRIHWGHIVSDDLIHWREEKTAIDPDSNYDIKGAWSGCVFSESNFSNGKPQIFYTSADFSRASISQASPLDDELLDWSKSALNPMFYTPSGMDEDFRDPFVFTANDKLYMIVGGKKNGLGAATLHRFDEMSNSWSNDGSLFFQSSSTAYGTFWEMPFVVPFDNNKFLFGTTQLGGINGVETLYWVGNVNSDGTFTPISKVPKEIELGNMSKNGYGCLSPSVMKLDNKTIAIGIVPDKLSSQQNYSLGWAHLFSFPREWTLDSENNLIQKPYEGLSLLHSDINYQIAKTELKNQIISLHPVEGKEFEIDGEFILKESTDKVGFNIRKNGTNEIRIYYEKSSNKLVVDATKSRRLINDAGIYDGFYSSQLPDVLNSGDNLKINIFVDHSILEIFINEKWAFSVRIFPYKTDANSTELFSEGEVEVVNVQAWNLKKNLSQTSLKYSELVKPKIWIDNSVIRYEGIDDSSQIQIYDIYGRILKHCNTMEELTSLNLSKGQIYLFKIITPNSKSQIFKLII